MNKVLLTFALIIIGHLSNAQNQYWHTILSENEHLKFISSVQILDNDTIVFTASSDGVRHLYSFSIVSNQLNQINTVGTRGAPRDLVFYNNEIYFLTLIQGAGFHRLWKTDGTASGTSQVSDITFISHGSNQPSLYVHQNTLFGTGDDNAVIEFKDGILTRHSEPFFRPSINQMCVFGAQDFIVSSLSVNPMLLHVNGSIRTELTSLIPQGFRVINFEQTGNDCFINFKLRDEEYSPRGVLKVSQSGATKLFREDEFEFQVNILQIFIHKDQKYAFTRDNNITSFVQLGDDESITSTIFSDDTGAFTEYTSTANMLYLNYKNSTINQNTHYTYDSENNSLTQFQTGSNLSLPSIHTTTQSDFFVNRPASRRYLSAFQINTLNESSPLTQLESNGFGFNGIITSNYFNATYFFLTDQSSGLKSIFSLNTKPKIDTLLNGIWHDPTLENQGLFIRQGNRFNGSRYIFSTIYTYLEGKPLWLAGVADYSPDQDTITINLTDYKGGSFLEPDPQPTQSIFGTLTIEPTTCHELRALVSSESQEFELNLIRIDNTSFDKYCLQAIDNN